MKQGNPLHNPFINRFNDPVTRRLDEMQSLANMPWPRDRNHVDGSTQRQKPVTARLFAGVFGLLVLLVSVAVLFKAM